jgi:hypothetical protein
MRKIKYDWLPFEAYDCLSSLRKALENVLSEYGEKYLTTPLPPPS